MDSRIEALRAEINRLNDLYYNDGESDTPDEVYDSLKRQLRELEGETDDPLSPLNKVGAASSGGFEKVKHVVSMLSLQNVYNEDELTDWLMGLPSISYATLEYKLDGASLDLYYVDGKLKYASTRGDGEIGDDVTDNAIHFEGVPQEIDFKGRVNIRGECIVPHHFFHRACERRAAKGKKVYANPRNMVAGLLRSKEGESLLGMGIRFIAYDCVMHTDKGQVSVPLEHVDDKIIGKFYVAESIWKGQTSNVEQIMDHINDMTERRDELDYDIDGLVLKLLDQSVRDVLGYRSTSPRWAVAYKFEAQTTTSILEAIEVQVGRTGVMTPVAKIKPVGLCGVTISSVTLHNFDEINRLDLRIGDTVVVSRRGDVIPKIESVVTALRLDEHGLINTPETCPCCGAPLAKKDDTAVELYCTNKVTCPAQVVNKMVYFVSRDGIDVKHLGPAAVESLIVTGVLGSFASLFYLTEQDFYAAGIGEAMTDKIMSSIEGCKKLPFYKALRAVGIPDIGDTTARELAGRFPSFGALLSASDEELLAVPDVGPIVVSNIRTIDDALEADLTSLDKLLTYIDVVIPKAEVQDLAGKTVVVTGSNFDGKSRREMEGDVVARGAKLTKSISKSTDIVFAGTGAGPDKIKKVKELSFIEDGIKWINPNSITRIEIESVK